MALVLVGFSIFVLGLAAAMFFGHRMLMNPPNNAASLGDGMGPIADVFNPLGADAKENLKEYEAKIEVAPSPDDEDPKRIDLSSGKVYFNKSDFK